MPDEKLLKWYLTITYLSYVFFLIIPLSCAINSRCSRKSPSWPLRSDIYDPGASINFFPVDQWHGLSSCIYVSFRSHFYCSACVTAIPTPSSSIDECSSLLQILLRFVYGRILFRLVNSVMSFINLIIVPLLKQHWYLLFSLGFSILRVDEFVVWLITRPSKTTAPFTGFALSVCCVIAALM